MNVRKIVLDRVQEEPGAAVAYLNDPAMRYGIQVAIGVLTHVGAYLTETGTSVADAERVLAEVARRCSNDGGQASAAAMAAANTQMWPGPDSEEVDISAYGSDMWSRRRAQDGPN